MKASTLNTSTVVARNAQASAPIPTGEAKPIKTPGRAYVVATEFQRNVFAVAFSTGAQVNKVIESARARMLTVVRAQYGDVSPTYEQFKADRSAFSALALERGLVDDQVIRKPYCNAIVELFGALPVSDSPAAVAKRLQRPVVDKTAKAAKTDTPPVDRPVTVSDKIGQMIALHGPALVLIELAKILGTAKETMIDAKALVAIASHFKAA